jgi:hypothetical protein
MNKVMKGFIKPSLVDILVQDSFSTIIIKNKY